MPPHAHAKQALILRQPGAVGLMLIGSLRGQVYGGSLRGQSTGAVYGVGPSFWKLIDTRQPGV